MKSRVLTAFALLGIGVVVMAYGGLPMFFWVLLIGLCCAYELMGMLRHLGQKALPVLVYPLVFFGMWTAYFPVTQWIWLHPVTMGASFFVIFWGILELIQKRVFFPKHMIFSSLRIVVFVVFTTTYIYLLREGHAGLLHIVFAMLVIWATDILALFGGRFFGKTPLTHISPKKTWEGTVSGLFGGVIVSAIYIFFIEVYFDIPLDMVTYMGIAVGISIVAQLGDLHESLIKRHFQVKDSSGLLPGHGGFYDRADSTLFVVPFLFYLFNLG